AEAAGRRDFGTGRCSAAHQGHPDRTFSSQIPRGYSAQCQDFSGKTGPMGGEKAVMKALVTGGGGFLGGAVVRRLRARGDDVRSFSRGDYPELRSLGVEIIRGDLADPEAVASAVQGCDIVFHVAAKAGIWGPHEEYYRANVIGTQNVIAACR